MIKLRYNILAGVQVGLSMVFFVSLISLFGISQDSDAFLVAFAMISSIHLLQLMFLEQFLYFFQQLKTISRDSAIEFFQSALLFAVVVGLIFYMTFNYYGEYFIEFYGIFAEGENDTLLNVKSVFLTLILGLILYPISYVNDRLLNAEKRFSLPYISESLPYAFMVIIIMAGIFGMPADVTVERVAEFRNYGMVLGVITTTSVIWKMGFFTAWKPKFGTIFYEFIRNSISMRLSHNINNFGVAFIINSFLISLPDGVASIYHYALRAVIILKQVTVGPMYRIFQSELSLAFGYSNFDEVQRLISSFFKLSTIIYAGIIFLGWVMIEPVLALMNIQSNTEDYHRSISDTFILIGIWHFFIVAEMAKTTLYMAAKDFIVFFIANSTIVCLLFAVIFFYSSISLQAMIITNAILQVAAFSAYSMIYRKKIKEYCGRNSY